MASDTVLEAGVVIDLSQVGPSLDNLTNQTQAATVKMRESFESAAAADESVIHKVTAASDEALKGFAKLHGGGILAFDALRAKVIESTAEVGRLRNEILQTDDQAKLAQLRASLAQATAEMSAARTELRAMRFEAAEATEKLNLMGESLGVRLPGALGQLLGRLPAVQAAMAAAFQITLVAFFISMIKEGIEKLGELGEEAAGFGREAQKAYQDVLNANQKAIVSSIELQDKIREISTVGTQGVVKFALEQKNSAAAIRDMGAELGRANRALADQQEKMQHLRNAADFWHDPLYGLTGATTALKEGEAELERYKRTVEELEPKVREALAFKRPKEEATEAAAERDRLIADETASMAARKRINDSYISYYESGIRQLAASHQITQEAEVEAEISAVNARLEVQREYTRERLALLAQEAKTGKNVTPEVTGLKADQAAQEADAQRKINEIRNNAEIERLAHDNVVSLALAESTRSGAEAEANYVKQSAREELDSRKIGIDQYVEIVKAANAKIIEEDRSLLEERLRIASKNPYANQADIISINQQVANLKQKQLADEAALDAEAAKKRIADEKRAAEETLRNTIQIANIQETAAKQSDERRLRDHEITLTEWANLERAALDKWKNDQLAALEANAEVQKRLFGEQSTEYRRVLDEMSQLQLKWENDVDRINQQVAARFQQTMNVISGSFSNAFGRMLTEHTRFANVAANFWNEMVRGWANMGLQIVANYVQTLAKIVVQETLTALRINVIHSGSVTAKKATESLWDEFLTAIGVKRVAQTTTEEVAKTSETTTGVATRQAVETAGAAEAIATTVAKNDAIVVSEAGAAGAAAYASAMAALPFPANVAAAPAFMAEAIATALSNLGLASAAEGGVLDKDRLVQAHAKEMILPAPISTGLQNVVNAGGLNAPTGAPSALAPRAASPGGPTNQTVNNHHTTQNFEVNLHHSGPDARQVLDKELLPRVRQLMRKGVLPSV